MDLIIKKIIDNKVKEVVPIGCLLLYNDEKKFFFNGKNTNDHCELKCINWGNSNNISWEKAVIFITCEPCTMCLTALSLVKIKKIIFGCYNTKFGGITGAINLFNSQLALYKPEIIGGIREIKCELLIKNFFKNCR